MLKKYIIRIRLIKRKYYIYTINNNNIRNIILRPHPNYPDNAWEAIDG
jgi:hypothetical protein